MPPPGISRRAWLAFSASLRLTAQPPPANLAPQLMPFAEAWPILARYQDLWPPDWPRQNNPSSLARLWPHWLRARQAALAERMQQGELETTVNILLFGVSFTAEPRITPEEFPRIEAAKRTLNDVIDARIRDLLRAASLPSRHQRLQLVQQVLRRHQLYPLTPEALPAAHDFLKTQTAAFLARQRAYEQQREAWRRSLSPKEVFLSESTLYQERGLSLDTSLAPSFAIHRALAAAALPPRSLRRAGVIGPGLDLMDKAAGFDLYPPQSLQPFLLLDSLLSLKLAADDAPPLYVFDLNPRTLAYFHQLQRRAASRLSDQIHLIVPAAVPWSQDFLRYFDAAGLQIATPTASLPSLRARPELKTRSLQLLPASVTPFRPQLWDVLTTRLPAPLAGALDLLVATNVFVYYNPLEQALAMRNVAYLLRPGGLLLTNTALPDLPETGLQPGAITAVEYSPRPADGDQIIHFRRTEN